MSTRAPYSLSPALLVVRILLCAAFLPSGLRDLGTVEYSGDEAVQVRRLLDPVPEKPETPPEEATNDVAPASLRQATAPEPVQADPDPSTVTARALMRKAMLIEDSGMGSPVLFAWLVVLVQIVGSSLLLLGLLSRVWALGLCIITAGNFVFISLPVLCSKPLMYLSPAGDVLLQTQAGAELGLFGSSLVVMLCGAGAFSLDRMLFGGTRAMRRARMHDREDEDDG